MNKVVIAFDIDGTLRCNCTPTCQDVNQRILTLLSILRTFKNVNIMIWSGGGAEYARSFMRPFAIHHVCFASKIDPTTWQWGKPDIAIDDQQEFNMAIINLIVKEK